MGSWIEAMGNAALIGIGATAVMDIWLVLLKKRGVPIMNFALLGRWVGHVFRGRWFHGSITKSAPVGHELAIGWSAHYGIGIGLAMLHVGLFGAGWIANPTLVPALVTGIVTVVAPLFIMQPAIGSGIAASKTGAPLRNIGKSVFNHGVFGSGIYLAAIFLRWL